VTVSTIAPVAGACYLAQVRRRLGLLLALAAASGCRGGGHRSAFSTPDGGVDATALFSATCAKCHGDDLRADTEQGHLVGAKDLTLDEARRMSNADIEHQIRVGKGRMPAFTGAFSDDEISALVAEVRRRQAQPRR
jgi:mono/diheme cytochrome c family protein